MTIRTLVDVCRRHAAETPSRIAYSYLHDGETLSDQLTFGELDHRARAVAVELRRHASPGDRALLLYGTSLDYVTAFMGCLYAGVTAVPAYPTRHGRRWKERLLAVIQDAAPSIVLARGGTETAADLAAECALPILGHVDIGAAAEWRQPDLKAAPIAFLQYTSGTTASPRGVMVGYDNLMHQQRMLHAAFGLTAESTVVSWLPLYHDMGLIGSVLHTLYVGGHCVLMSPAAFLQKPLRWLQAIDRFRATTSGGPNFAYDLCARKVAPADAAALDLSSWTVAFNGAEPVRARTMNAFSMAFQSAGFNLEAFRPCYGLAEATLMVSVAPPLGGDAVVAPHVGVGTVAGDQHAIVVDPQRCVEVEAGTVGEIWVHGGSVAHGYWNREEESARVFRARLTGGMDHREYLRTGDLGYASEGALAIVGRLKDVIVINGRNHFAEELEDTIQADVPQAAAGITVAFEIEQQGESQLVIVQEVDDGMSAAAMADVIHAIRQSLVREHGVQANDVVLVSPRSIPRTPSGKKQRRLCAEDYLASRLGTLAASPLQRPQVLAPAVDAGTRSVADGVVRAVVQVLGASSSTPVDENTRLSSLGLDSIRSVELQTAIDATCGVALPLSDVLGSSLVRDLIACAGARGTQPPASQATSSSEGNRPPALSEGQRAMWLVDALSQEKDIHSITRAARVQGPLYVDALREAFRAAAVRHDALRTTFPSDAGGNPVAVIHRSLEPQFDVVSAASAEEAESVIAAFVARPLDLTTGPLLRVLAISLSPEEHRLVMSVHHIVADLWSLCLLLEEVGSVYTALVAGAPRPAVAPAPSYQSYVAAQQRKLEGPAGESLRQYWSQTLSGSSGRVEFPAARAATNASFRGATHRTHVAPKVSRSLAALAETRGATLYMTLLAAFQVLLHRYTGQQDIVVASPFHGRSRREEQETVGYLVNLLPLRADLSRNDRFTEHLRTVREAVLGAYAHQDYPFHLMLDTRGLRRDAGHISFGNVLFVLQSAPADVAWPAFASGTPGVRLELGALTLESIEVASRTSAFDLTVTAAVDGDGIALAWNYRTDLLDTLAVEAMARHFDVLLGRIVADPERRVRHYELTDGTEARLASALAASEGLASDSTLHGAFERQVERQPHAVALIDGEERITYYELNVRANRLARELWRRGVRQESRVGIYMERSAAVVVSILAVLKTGAAYVPIDPAYPAARATFMMEDSRVSIVLTHKGLAARLPDGAGLALIDVAGVEGVLTRTEEDGGNLGAPSSPVQLAYVIYTSGSTGLPKGTMIEHRQVVRLFTATAGWYGFGPSDVWSLFHSFAFDVSVWEIWGALLHGGRLVIVPHLVSRSPEEFYKLLARERVTILCQTPSAFRRLPAVDQEQQLALSLRAIIFAGEALDVTSVRAWLARHGDLHPTLVNMYGITETTVHVTYHRLLREEMNADGAAVTPIGRPMPDLQIYLLDEAMQPVPIGVPGEIFVGGPGVARGYSRRAALTAERFVPNPFAAGRLYRSGDLARFEADGSLRYLGRIDTQVKIRGFRVELGEVEVALRQHAAVRDCAVIAREDADGERRLAAYVVWDSSDEAPDAAALRSHAAATLPDYLLPQAFVFIDHIPLTTNGKLDRAALPSLPTLATASRSWTAPDTPAERTLCEVWERVLSLERLGVTDNFFELGGDSIRCLQVVSLARERGMVIALADMFTHQTIRALAATAQRVGGDVDASRPGAAPFSLVTDADRERLQSMPNIEDAYPLAVLQAGLMFHSEYEPDYVVYSASVGVRARFDRVLMERAIEYAMRRHPLLRTSYDLRTFAEPLQLVHATAPIPLVVEDYREIPIEERPARLAEWFEQEKRLRFDWSQAPLFRVVIHILDRDVFQFAFTHGMLDGWSTAVATAELFRAYLELLEGATPVAQVPATRFSEFIALEREALRSEEHLAFWERRLAADAHGAIPRWPTPRRTALPARRTFRMDKDVFTALVALARSEHVLLRTVFLAAHFRVLGLLTGRNHVVTGVLANGRVEGLETDKVLGMFLNALPLSLNLRGGTWKELLADVYRLEQDAFPYRRFPFAELQRRHGRQPLFESAFNITDFHVHRELLHHPGLEVVDRLPPYDQTFFPLTTYVEVDAFSDAAYVHLDINTDDLGDLQVEAMESLFTQVLGGMAANPSARYDADSWIDQRTREMLTAWTPRPEPASALAVHEWIARTAERFANKVAVRSKNRTLTYRQLMRQADRVARELLAHGAGLERVVAVRMRRSADLYVALLGVLKAGAAYLPLDPELPMDRAAYMVADAGAAVLLTEQGLLASAPEVPLTIALDTLADVDVSGETVSTAVAPQNLAYVIYTSGSTGRPKGVGVVHEALTNLLQSMADMPGLASRDSWLAVTTFSFDLSIPEIFLPLVVGASVTVAESPYEVDSLVRLFDECQPTVMQAAPAMWQMLIDAGWHGRRDLKLLCGGEPMRRDLARALIARAESVWNVYGPTETTVFATCHHVVNADGDAAVGRPLRNVTCRVLGSSLYRLPIGAVGELYVGGRALARGYIGRPGLTAGRFVPDPFSEQPGARLYASGDFARHDLDGTLHALGRVDQQLKVRGFRIEPGEIEAGLTQHPAVRQACVVGLESGSGVERLIAFLVTEHGVVPDTADLKQFLRKTLPEYMVPARFVGVERLPLTPAGKIDRRALAASEPPGHEPERQQQLPRTATERRLASIWQAVLGQAAIGVDQDFFEIGGHSLLAVRVVTRVRAEFDLPLPVTALFETPTIARLALAIDSLQRQEDSEVDSLLDEVESLSDEEVRRRLVADSEVA